MHQERLTEYLYYFLNLFKRATHYITFFILLRINNELLKIPFITNTKNTPNNLNFALL